MLKKFEKSKCALDNSKNKQIFKSSFYVFLISLLLYKNNLFLKKRDFEFDILNLEFKVFEFETNKVLEMTKKHLH